MNILILSWRGPGHPHAGGAEVSTHEHAKGWINAGHEVTLFTSSYKSALHEEIVDGVKIIRKGTQVFGVQIEAIKWYLFGKHNGFDIVIDQFHGLPFFTPLFVRVKKIAFIHEVTKEVWAYNPWKKPFNLIPYILGTIFEPFIFKLFYKNIPFMTVSESTKLDLVQWGIPSANITVIHNGISIPKVNKYPKENKKTVLFLGAISKDKGIEDALEIFKEVDKLDPYFQFWVVGKSESHYLNYLKQKIDVLGLSSKVKFFGFVPESKKFELLQKAHILVMPSIREGWGLVVIEAAAMGTPTVGYDVPGLRDSIKNGATGLLIPHNNVEFAKKLVHLLDDHIKYVLFSKNCIKWANNFGWDKSIKLSLKLINTLFH